METGDPKPTGGPRTARTMKPHQGYKPLLPNAKNINVQHKWDKASYDQHREKVKSARSMLNITPPKIYSHLALGLKKQQFVEERTRIQRENTLLLNNIILIKSKSGGIDNWNHYTEKSLGTVKRRQDVLRIQKENQKLHLYLTDCRSNYDVRGWQKDWHKHLKLMDSITRYPRGRSNLQKGQDKPLKKPSGCDEEQNNSAESKEKPGENKEKTELEEAANPRAEMQPVTAANPIEHAPTSDNIQVKEKIGKISII